MPEFHHDGLDPNSDLTRLLQQNALPSLADAPVRSRALSSLHVPLPRVHSCTRTPSQDDVVVPVQPGVDASAAVPSATTPGAAGTGPAAGTAAADANDTDSVYTYVRGVTWVLAPCVKGVCLSARRVAGRAAAAVAAMPCSQAAKERVLTWSQRATMTQKSIVVFFCVLALVAMWYMFFVSAEVDTSSST